MKRFSLRARRWYAAELIGEEFGSAIRSYTPIRVDRLTPEGGRSFTLAFYHANYPKGVRSKVYELETLERNGHFILARSRSHDPARILLIHEITVAWLREHVGASASDSDDPRTWLERNA